LYSYKVDPVSAQVGGGIGSEAPLRICINGSTKGHIGRELRIFCPMYAKVGMWSHATEVLAPWVGGASLSGWGWLRSEPRGVSESADEGASLD
jgi:hypothetical protein